MATALAELGVTERTLDPATQERLDRDGYAPLPGMLTDEQLNRARTRVAELAAAEGEAAGREVHQEAGTDRLADLVNKDPVSRSASPTRGCWPPSPTCSATSSSPRSTAAPPFPARACRRCTPRAGRRLGPYQVCNSIWLLDDFTEENGATRVVPGSHRGPCRPATRCPTRPPRTPTR